MRSVNNSHLTTFIFPIAEKTERVGEPVHLTYSDLQRLPGITKQVLACREFLSTFLEYDIFCDGSQVEVRVRSLRSAKSASLPLTLGEIDSVCVRALDNLARVAADIARNAQQPSPRPLGEISPDKRTLTLIKALSSERVEGRPAPRLCSQGREYQLPILAPADFTSTDTEATQSKEGSFRIIGLVRGEEQNKHEFMLEGGSRVLLPKTASWAWGKIHDILDYEGCILGTLIRASASDAWSVTDDTELVRQPRLF
jgi:hypothetical protein